MVLIKHIFIDIDDVLADFGLWMCRYFGIERESVTSWYCHKACGVSETEWREWLNSRSEWWWSGLPLIEGAKEFVAHCQSMAPVTFATAANFTPGCVGGRKLWLQRHFPNVKAVTIEEKHLLAQPGRVLIDDADKNVKAFKAAGGSAITFPRPWNENRGVASPYLYAASELTKLESGEGKSVEAYVESIEYETPISYRTLGMLRDKFVAGPLHGRVTLKF